MNKAIVKRLFFRALNIFACLFLCLLWLAPFGWVLSTSMRPRSEAFRLPPSFFPEIFDLTNYVKVFQAIPIVKFMSNSFFIAALTTLLMLLITGMAPMPWPASIFAKKSWLCRSCCAGS